jgi:hypothetical protein
MESRIIDWILALALLVIGFAIGFRILLEFGFTNFGQEWMPAAVMWACGYGLVDPASTPPTLLAFLKMETLNFDCRDLASVGRLDHTTAVINANLYLGLAAAVFWRLLGVSYFSLAPLLGIFYGAYVAGCFVLLRLFIGRGPAVFATAILAISPVAVNMLRNFRDFSKAPFIIWTISLLILAVRERRPKQLTVIAGIMGLVVGIGMGFRADLRLVALVAIIVLAFGLDRTVLPLRTRLFVLFIFTAVSGAIGLPASTKTPGMGLYALQGMAEPFRAFVGVTKPSYDTGYLYFDAYTLASIAADLRRRDPDAWDLHETKTSDVHESYTMTQANGYVLGWMPLFVGDLVTRGLKSAAWIAGYYALFSPNHSAPDLASTFVVKPAKPYFLYIAQPWLPIIGLLGSLSLVFRTFDRSPREAACLSFILIVLLMSPGIQFSIRHLFQYEIVFWLGAFSLLYVLFEFGRLRRSVYSFSCWLVALLILGAAGYAAVLTIQDFLLKQQVQRLLDAQREPVTWNVVDVRNGMKLVEIPLPSAATRLPGFSPDGVDEALRQTLYTAEHMRISALAMADRLLVTIGGPDCAPGAFKLTLSYEGLLGFSRPLMVDAPATGDKTLLITAAFYTPLERFRGIAVPSDRASCIVDVSKMHDEGKLPSTFTIVLRPDWRSEHMFQRLGAF